MKTIFHILILATTLLWMWAPLQRDEYFSIHEETKIQCLQDDAGTQSFLVNLASKPDTQVNLSLSATLPDLPSTDIVRFSGHNEWTREHASFVGSHQIFTQITSSYL